MDLSIRDENGLLAKQVTKNQQIHDLIEKYEHKGGEVQVEHYVFDEIKEEEGEEADEQFASLPHNARGISASKFSLSESFYGGSHGSGASSPENPISLSPPLSPNYSPKLLEQGNDLH